MSHPSNTPAPSERAAWVVGYDRMNDKTVAPNYWRKHQFMDRFANGPTGLLARPYDQGGRRAAEGPSPWE